jgi:hypothetical protein
MDRKRIKETYFFIADTEYQSSYNYFSNRNTIRSKINLLYTHIQNAFSNDFTPFRGRTGASEVWVRRQGVIGTASVEPRSGALYVEATYPKKPEPHRGGLYDDFTVRSYGAHLS